MAIYSFNNNSLQKVETTTFNIEGILERQHLQTAIKHKIDVIAPNCLVISEEFSEWTGSQRRIDLLAIDKEGNLVVIELKRTETGEYMDLQALRYAAMVSTLTFNLAVIQQWVNENKPNSLSDLLQAFPQKVRGSGLFVPEQDAKEIYARQSIYRHFLGDGEILEFPDSTRYAISNQWGKGNIERFIEQSKKIGYEIEETS